ncbi:MAG: hypothetical protein ACO3A4_09655 [Silvanigrellaceae bacterium]
MKSIALLAASLVVSTLVACGTDNQSFNENLAQQDQNSATDAVASSADGELGLGRDACQVIAPAQLTYTKAQGGSVVIGYRFFNMTKGDRVKLVDASSGAVAWDSGELAEASGSLSISVSSLPLGSFRIHGFVNTLKTDSVADCAAGKILIRTR